jgi:hypothetical protein
MKAVHENGLMILVCQGYIDWMIFILQWKVIDQVTFLCEQLAALAVFPVSD